jgi:hypothetical protein
MLDPALVVADQPPVPQQPAECPLDHPAPADHLKAGQVTALDDLQGDAGEPLDPSWPAACRHIRCPPT